VGALVVCQRIDHESHRTLSVDASVLSDDGLASAAMSTAAALGLEPRLGSSITVDEAAWGPDEKAAHHAWKAHDIVEMESFWIGEAAVQAGARFLAVRTISDSSDHRLLKTGAMRDDGTFDQDAVASYLARNPDAAAHLAETGRRGRIAMASLARFMSAFLPTLAGMGVA
jgi:nucleoside phosphorylase